MIDQKQLENVESFKYLGSMLTNDGRCTCEIKSKIAVTMGMGRNCLLQRVFEGKIKGGIEVTGRRGRRRKKLLDYLKERRGYCHLKEEALDRTMWRAGFGRGFGPVVRQTAKWMNDVGGDIWP